MDFKVDIDAAAVNKMVSEAILKSAIGKELNKIIQEEAQKFSTSYNNPLRAVVEKEVAAIAATILREEYGDVIKERVKKELEEQISEKVVQEVIGKFIDKIWEKD